MRIPLTLVVTAAVLSLGNTDCGGGTPDPTPRPYAEPWDVRGNYALTYDNKLTLKLDIGGAVRERTADGYGGIVDFGTYDGQPVTLDLAEFCGRADVNCPSEAFPAQVAVNENDVQIPYDLHSLVVWDDAPHTPPPGVGSPYYEGWVNAADWDRFVLGLGGASGGSGNCGAMAISLAGERFSREGEHYEERTDYRDSTGATCTPPDAGTTSDCQPVTTRYLAVDRSQPIAGITEGKIALAWIGACAWGPFLAGASLTIETGYSGTWISSYDPPVFTPLDAGTP